MTVKNEAINEIIRKYPVRAEVATWLLALVLLMYMLRSMLLLGESTLVHDNLLWNYPIFQFFAENIINGHFPFWNPFSHGGEPFYPLYVQIRLLEPTTLLTIYFGHFLTNDIVMLFNWNRVIQSLLMVFGVYIVLRQFAKHIFIRLSLIPILLYSSFMLSSFRQDAILNQFMYVPFVAFFMLRIIYQKDLRWHNWILLGGFIGLNWQSYFFTGTWIFILVFSLGFVFFRRDLFTELIRSRNFALKSGAVTVIFLAMALPNISLMLEKDKYVFPARMADPGYGNMVPIGGPAQFEHGLSLSQIKGINMPYSFISYTGTFSNIWNFIQIIAPEGNEYIRWTNRNSWGNPSEAFMYIGLLPWAIAILGLIAGRHELRSVWLLSLAFFGLLMLGPPGGIHRLLYYLYPPVWFVRHTHTFVLFFLFAFLFFYVLGMNHLFSSWRGNIFSYDNFRENSKVSINYKRMVIIIFSLGIVLCAYLMTKVKYPVNNFMFMLILLPFAVGWFLRKQIGEKGLYISLIVSSIILVLIFSKNVLRFVEYIILVLGIPFSLFLFIRSDRDFSESVRYYAPVIILVIFSAAMTYDLVRSFKHASFLYKDVKHPGITNNINTAPLKPSPPQSRRVFPKRIYSKISEQSMRYPDLIYRQAFVLSAVEKPVDFSTFPSFVVRARGIFKGLTNKSFESWTDSNEDYNGILPEQFMYYQEGTGGSVERYTGADGVKEGKFSVLLRPSSNGTSFLRFETKDIGDIRGHYIRLSLWIRSQNRTPDAVQVDMQDYIGSQALKAYGNSGKWEHIIIGKHIAQDSTRFSISLCVNSSATYPAFFDGISAEVVDVNEDNLEFAMKSRRWSSLLMLRKYFELINAEIRPSIFAEIFAVDKPVFQFKHGVVQMEDNKAVSFFKQLGTAGAINLLRDSIIVDKETVPLLAKSGVSTGLDGKIIHAPAKNLERTKDIPFADRKTKFAYTTGRYEYDSFDIKVSSDEPGILYWADGYDKNWHAYIDGKEIPIYRANINCKAVILPKGTHKIIFTYEPFLFKIGIFVFYGIFISCVFAALMFSGLYAFKNK